jgi:hypothetical protein
MKKLLLMTVALALACTDKTEPANSTAGTGGNSNNAGDAGTTSGGTAGTAAGAAGTAAGAAGTAAGAAGTAAGTGGSGGADDLAARRACAPDCFWELVAPCRPNAECLEQTKENGWLQCTSDANWSVDHDSTRESYQTIVSKNGEVCYQINDGLDGKLDYYDRWDQPQFTVNITQNGSFIACPDDTDWQEFRLGEDDCEAYQSPSCVQGSCE